MLARQSLLANGERALEQRLSLGVAALPLVERGEVAQFGSDQRGFETERLFHQHDGALVERLRQIVVALTGMNLAEVVQRGGEFATCVALLQVRDHTLRQRQCFRISAGAHEGVDPRALRGETFLGDARRDKRCGDRERQTRNQRPSIPFCHDALAAAF
ncbi:hypothetical protein ACVWXM_003036 [Bradyrhizobium sp. GM7.3]